MALEFYLNDEKIALNSVRADDTVLDFLRENKRLKGTKEGCAEGDCGACTVLVGRLHNGQLRYQSMNACIALMPMLHRAHLVTIEALSANGELNWVQKALSDYHGTQCGFCTPGIVMSLYAAWMNANAPLGYEDFQTALQGNLCRCTGYASILRGMMAEAPNADRAADPLIAHRLEMQSKLEALPAGMLAMEGDAPFFVPQSLAELEAVAAMNANATFIAGATDAGLWITKSFRRIDPAIFLHQVEELNQIEIFEDSIQIGAMVSFEDAALALRSVRPELEEFWMRIAGPQIRNMGTLGGNIANGSPIGDTPPLWIALDARLRLNLGGERREIPLEDFFIEYGKQDRKANEFVEAIILPRAENYLRVYKVSKRPHEDISAMLMAMAWQVSSGKVSDIRIAFGGMAATPKRAKHAEVALLGKEWNEANIRAAMAELDQDFSPLSDARASAEYRMKVAQNSILRAFEEG